MGQKGGKMDIKKGQEGAREAQLGPKMVQVGPRWSRKGARRAPRGARKVQEGPSWPQERPEKKGPRILLFFDKFGGLFWRPFWDLGGLLKPSGEGLFLKSFLDPLWGRPGR